MFTTMCPKEQQTRDNLIVKDYRFIIEIFDRFSFSGILRGCLSYLTLIYMGYFDNLFYMGGGQQRPPSLTLAFDFRHS